MQPSSFTSAAVARLDRLCLPALILLVVWVTWGHFAYPSPSPKPLHLGDFSLNVEAAQRVGHNGRYPPNFAYPPVMAIFWRSSARWGSSPASSSGSWFSLQPYRLPVVLHVSPRRPGPTRLAAGSS